MFKNLFQIGYKLLLWVLVLVNAWDVSHFLGLLVGGGMVADRGEFLGIQMPLYWLIVIKTVIVAACLSELWRMKDRRGVNDK